MHVYMIIFFLAGLFTIFRCLNTTVCFKSAGPATFEESKDFLLATLNPSFIDFKYI